MKNCLNYNIFEQRLVWQHAEQFSPSSREITRNTETTDSSRSQSYQNNEKREKQEGLVFQAEGYMGARYVNLSTEQNKELTQLQNAGIKFMIPLPPSFEHVISYKGKTIGVAPKGTRENSHALVNDVVIRAAKQLQQCEIENGEAKPFVKNILGANIQLTIDEYTTLLPTLNKAYKEGVQLNLNGNILDAQKPNRVWRYDFSKRGNDEISNLQKWLEGVVYESNQPDFVAFQ